MALDFSAFGGIVKTPTATTTKPSKTKLDFSAFGSVLNQQKKVEQPKSNIRILPSGGAYNVGATPDELIKTERTNYGGFPTKKGYERADIVPVSLGGVNALKENITYEPYPTIEKLKDKFYQMIGKDYVPQTKTDKYLMKEILPTYKSGKITLTQARVKAISYLNDEQMGLKKSVIANLPSAVKETTVNFLKGFISPFVSAGTSMVNVSREIGAIGTAVGQGKMTAPDYMSKTYNIPIYGKAEPMFTGKEKPVEFTKKVVGNALEIAPYFIGIPEAKGLIKIIDTIGAKSLSEITAKETLQFIRAYGTKVAASSLGLGIMFGLGGSIKEGADAKQTAINVAKSVGTIALLELFLSPIIKYGIKNVKGRTVQESVDKVIEDHQNLITEKVNQIKTELPIGIEVKTEPTKLNLSPLEELTKQPKIASLSEVSPKVDTLPTPELKTPVIKEGGVEKGISDLQPLLQKAKASGQSFDEWVKGQGKEMYHGTERNFEVFTPNELRSKFAGKAGTYFSSNPIEASGFGRNIKTAFLDKMQK